MSALAAGKMDNERRCTKRVELKMELRSVLKTEFGSFHPANSYQKQAQTCRTYRSWSCKECGWGEKMGREGDGHALVPPPSSS